MDSDNMNEGAWKIGSNLYFSMRRCETGYDYTIYDKCFKEIDGGCLDTPDISFFEAFAQLLTDFRLMEEERKKVDYELLQCIVEKVGA